MTGIGREFRDFLMRGNVVELAVGVISGVVFGAVVQSLVNDVVLQLVAALVGAPDFSALSWTLNGTDVRYGSFLTNVLKFVITMAAVFLFIVKPMNLLTERVQPPPTPGAPTVRECPECLSEVPAAARRCRACAAALSPVATTEPTD